MFLRVKMEAWQNRLLSEEEFHIHMCTNQLILLYDL